MTLPVDTASLELQTGKNIQPLKAGQLNVHKAQAGAHYRVVNKGADARSALLDNVVARREGDDLVLHYSDGTKVRIDGFYKQCGEGACTVNLPGDGQSTYGVNADEEAGTALDDGSTLIYAHGEQDLLLAMSQSQPALYGVLGGLDSQVITYVPATTPWSGLLLPLGIAGAAAALAADHNDSSTPQPSPAPTPEPTPTAGNSISGIITAGPILGGNDLMVKAYKADGVSRLGTARVDAGGHYEVSLGDYIGVVIVRASNQGTAADHLDEASNSAQDLGITLLAMGFAGAGNTIININPLTSLAALKAGIQAAELTTDGILNADDVARVNAAVGELSLIHI